MKAPVLGRVDSQPTDVKNPAVHDDTGMRRR